MYSKIITLVLSSFVFLCFGGDRETKNSHYTTEQMNPHLRSNAPKAEQNNPPTITGKWYYYNCKEAYGLILDIQKDKSITLEEIGFFDVASSYSGTYTYSDGKLNYTLSNTDLNQKKKGTLSISFTKEGQMKVKFPQKFEAMSFSAGNTLTFHQENTDIPFKETPSVENFYKAIYPYIFERDFCESYDNMFGKKTSKTTKVTYAINKYQISYTAVNEDEYINAKIDLRVWSYPKSDDKLICISNPSIWIDPDIFRSFTIHFYRYDAQKKRLIHLDEETVMPVLKKRHLSKDEEIPIFLRFPKMDGKSSPNDGLELLFYGKEKNENRVTKHYKLKWNGATFK